MNKEEIKTLLHHREPYLMVDEVNEISETSIKTLKEARLEEPYLQGHFPNMPVVPGAMLQEFCTQSAGILLTKFHSGVKDYHSEKTKGHAIGVLNKVESAKYYQVCKPGAINAEITLKESQDNLFKFKAKVTQNGELMAKINFNLVNAPESVLH